MNWIYFRPLKVPTLRFSFLGFLEFAMESAAAEKFEVRCSSDPSQTLTLHTQVVEKIDSSSGGAIFKAKWCAVEKTVCLKVPRHP